MGELTRVQRVTLGLKPEPGGAIMSINPDTDEGKRLLCKAFTMSDGIVKREIGKSLSVVNFVVHEVERPDDDTGEVKLGMRAVYFLSDGRQLTSSSWPLWRSLCTIASVFKLSAPFEPPLVVVVRSAPTQKAGQDYLYFDMP